MRTQRETDLEDEVKRLQARVDALEKLIVKMCVP